MNSIAVFGGTAEGRILAGQLASCGFNVCVFVATAYGEDAMQEQGGVAIRPGRIDRSQMAEIFKSEGFDAVVDATHPYAGEVTKNLVSAANDAEVFYLRIARDKAGSEDLIMAQDAAGAAEILNRMQGRILLTTGSKEIEAFLCIEDWENRLFARILPDHDIVRRCAEKGFRGRNLICMQGPFTHEMNVAMIKMLDIGIVVAKDSGDAGGFPEKLSASKECGAKLIVIRRPEGIRDAEGVSIDMALDILKNRFNPQNMNEEEPCPRFPIFISLKGKNVFVAGGGNIATRRIRALLEFGAEVTVAAPEISDELKGFLGSVNWKQEQYRNINGNYSIAIAATNVRSVNKQVGEDAKKKGIPVSVADSGEESTFWFPAIARGGGIVAGVASEDGNHGMVKRAAERIRKNLEVMTDG